MTRAGTWLKRPIVRMGPPPRSPATEAHGCFMVRIPDGSYRIQDRGARFARTGGLPSVRFPVAPPRHKFTPWPDNDTRHRNERCQMCPPKIIGPAKTGHVACRGHCNALRNGTEERVAERPYTGGRARSEQRRTTGSLSRPAEDVPAAGGDQTPQASGPPEPASALE